MCVYNISSVVWQGEGKLNGKIPPPHLIMI
jgi:hypothetical protein